MAKEVESRITKAGRTSNEMSNALENLKNYVSEEVAEVAEFLCSERNTYTTGSVWSVKGASG